MSTNLFKPLAAAAAAWALPAMAAVLSVTFLAHAGEDKKPSLKPDAASAESQIRASVDSYVAAYNRGDAKAVAAHWSDSAEWVSPEGQRVQGRPAIEKALVALFAENKGVRIEVIEPSIRMVASDVAVEEGAARVLRPGEPPSDSTYLAIHVKRDGQWKLDSVHETNVAPPPTAASPLDDLAWLVGQWIDESPEAAIETSVTWTKNNAFLNYSFKVSAAGMDDLEGTQVIGWDPAAGVIRSWMFDSDGGFGEGVWSKKDNVWTVKFSQVLPDGRQASATNVYTLVDADTFTWKSIGRKVDGQFQPNIEEAKVVRKGVEAASKAVEKPRKQDAKK